MENLLFVGIVQALFTAMFLASKRNIAPSDQVLAVWMVFIALPMVSGVLIRLWPDVHFPILSAGLIYPLTYGPFMWLYVKVLTGDVSRLSRRDLVHFLPFLIVSVVQLLSGWTPAPPNPEELDFSLTIRAIGFVNLALLLGYTSAIFWRLSKHDQQVVQYFSELPNQITLAWVRWFTAGTSLVFLLLFLASVFSRPELLKVHLPAQVGLILALSFFGLRQTQVFPLAQDANEKPQPESKSPENEISPQAHSTSPPPAPAQPTAPQPSNDPKARYARSGLTQDHAEKIFLKLDAYMKANQPYLCPDLTIEALAKQLAVSRHHLTEVISLKHQKNYYVFVNEYRVQAVKQALNDPEKKDLTLLDVAYTCGFNSKTPFNTAFRRLTGMTPSQYRRQKV